MIEKVLMSIVLGLLSIVPLCFVVGIALMTYFRDWTGDLVAFTRNKFPVKKPRCDTCKVLITSWLRCEGRRFCSSRCLGESGVSGFVHYPVEGVLR